MKSERTHPVLTVILLLLTLVSTHGQSLTYQSAGQKGPNLEILSSNLKKTYADSAVGWAFTISKNGKQLIDQSGGAKITAADRLDNRAVPFTSATRLHVASFSKVITAVAIAKLVDQKKMKWDDPVKKFLPSYWELHADFESLTIRDLVTMRSGLNAPLDAVSSHTDSLRKLMRKGPDPKKVGIYNYQNTSYGLLRIITGYAEGYQELKPAADSLVVGTLTAKMYKAFINTYLFQPAGVQSADCGITDQEPAFHYPFPYNNERGELTGTTGTVHHNGDLTDYAGGFGWYLSAAEAAKFINAVFVTNTILSQAILKELFGNEFPIRIRKNAYGEHFGFGGDWGRPTDNKGWRGIHAYFFCFPDELVITLFVNSGEGSPARRVIRAYEQAFK